MSAAEGATRQEDPGAGCDRRAAMRAERVNERLKVVKRPPTRSRAQCRCGRALVVDEIGAAAGKQGRLGCVKGDGRLEARSSVCLHRP